MNIRSTPPPRASVLSVGIDSHKNKTRQEMSEEQVYFVPGTSFQQKRKEKLVIQLLRETKSVSKNKEEAITCLLYWLRR